MASAAISEPNTASVAPDIYVRSVWSKLAAGAFLAAIVAWTITILPPLRAAILIEHGVAAIGLTLLGVALATAPVLIWVVARLLARRPNVLNPIWYWCFIVAAAVAANTLALLFLRESVAMAFALVALGFAAIGLVHRVARLMPAWACALVFAAIALLGEYAINVVLKAPRPFTPIDVVAICLFALMIAMRADAFPRIRAMLRRPTPKGGVTYAAMHLIALADAPTREPETAPKQET